LKLNDYNQMMSYMRRPGFQDGTPQSTLINKMQTLKEAKGSLMPRSKVSILKMYMDEALKDGEITQEQHTEMLMPYFGKLGEKVTEQIEVSDRDNFAFGTEEPDDLKSISLEESTTGPGGFPMTAGVTVLPKLYNTVPKAVELIESGATTAAKAKKIVTDFLGQRQPYTGATKIGESTPKDFTPEKNFLEVLKSYMDKYTGGSLSQASKDLGVSRNVLKGINERINLQETGKRTSSLGINPYTKVAKIEEPIDGLEYSQMTTLMKNKPDKFNILKGGENKFLDQESLGHLLGVKFARDDKGIRTGIGKFQYDQLGNMLKKLNVKKNNIGEFNVDDAINKLLQKNKTKLVKGQRVSDAGKDRYTLEKKFDPELYSFRAQLVDRVGKRAKGLDVYLPNAVDDIGHPFSLSKSTKKYKNLFKDSNMNSINTLVYQDHTLNTQLHKITGFEGRYEKMFDQLSKLQNKKITPKIQKELIDVKNKMNANYNDYMETLSNPKEIKQLLTKNELNFADDFIKYLSSQKDRVQKIDINVPKIGDTFKSKDIFVDMSTVNPKYILGYVNEINPKAKKFKDLSMSEQAIFKQNALDQNANIVSEYYKKAKYPIDDVEAVKETVRMDFAEGSGKKVPALTALLNQMEEIPGDLKKAKYFSAGLKILGVAATPIVAYDIYKEFKKGTPALEALEKGLIGTNIIGSTKDVLDLSPEGREARSVIKQGEMREQIADDFSGLDIDFDTPNIKSDMSRQEAEQKYEKAKKVVDMERASEEKILANARAINMQGLTDLMLGKRFQPQEIPEQFLSTGGRAGYAEGGRIGFAEGLNFDKAIKKMLEKEMEEDKPVDILAEGEKVITKKLDSLTPNETEKEKEEGEMFNMVKEFQKLKRANPDFPMSFRMFSEQKKKEKELFKNKILNLAVKYPEKKIINDEGMVNKKELKETVNQAEANLEISPLDGLILKRSIDTKGDQSVTSGTFDINNFSFSSPSLEEGKLTSLANFDMGNLNLSGAVDSKDSDILRSGIAFNYDDILKGKFSESGGYKETELGLDKTLPISDKFNLNLKGDSNMMITPDDKTYKSSQLIPKLSYNDGILNASIAKEILEGGGKPNLNAGVNVGDFYAQGSNLLSNDESGVVGYQKDILDKDNLKFSVGGEMDPFTGEKTAGAYLKLKRADGGRIGFADGPDDPSKRKFIKIGAGLMSLPFVGKYFKAAAPVAEKAVEVIRRGADGMPDFITDLIAKVITLGKKSISGGRADEIAESYQLDNYVVTKKGNKTTVTKRNQQGDMLEKDMEMELDYDPETGGYTYNEATAKPDAEGKLRDVEEFIDEIDLEDMKKYTYNE
jgi:hypothetical protein